MQDKITAVILMAGVGKRMNSDVPKQYIQIDNKPVVYYTIKAFEQSNVDDIVLVTGETEIEYCAKKIVQYFNFNKVTEIVAGGKERYNSVHNGLQAVHNSKYVLIHDGARPCVTSEQINDMIEHVRINKACIMGVPSKDTIKIIDKEKNITMSPDRDIIWQAQTPQAFEFEGIMNAYSQVIENNDQFLTDDAQVWSLYNCMPVKMIEGAYENIKVTTPFDMEIVVNYLKKH